jgi:hypothetical protein
MVPRLLHRAGVRSAPLHGISLGCVGLCLSLWIRAKTVDQDERPNAERRALFVGLWPSMFWLIGDAVAACEHPRRAPWPRRLTDASPRGRRSRRA